MAGIQSVIGDRDLINMVGTRGSIGGSQDDWYKFGAIKCMLRSPLMDSWTGVDED